MTAAKVYKSIGINNTDRARKKEVLLAERTGDAQLVPATFSVRPPTITWKFSAWAATSGKPKPDESDAAMKTMD